MSHSESTARVLAAIDPEEVIGLTADLVKINSVWDPDAGTGEQAAAECAAAWAAARGFRSAWTRSHQGGPTRWSPLRPVPARSR